MQELFKHTPKDWPEHALLEKAMEEINRTVKGANEAKRVTDSLYEMVELQNSFVKPEVCERIRHVTTIVRCVAVPPS